MNSIKELKEQLGYEEIGLGKSKDILKYICLSFISFLPLFHFCCIYYFGSLIFCCQFVATTVL